MSCVLVSQRYEIFFGAAIFAWQFLKMIYIFGCLVVIKLSENQRNESI